MIKSFIRNSEITFIIILINIILFALESLAWWSTNTTVAVNFWVFYSPLFLLQPRRIITSMFLHFWIIHIVMNMYALYCIWPFVEKIFWKWKYLLIYILSWIWWNLMVFWVETLTWNFALSAWASWAIFWLLWSLVALIVSLPKDIRSRIDTKSVSWSIVSSLLISFLPWISLSAHLWWLIWWFLVSYILILIKKPRYNSNIN